MSNVYQVSFTWFNNGKYDHFTECIALCAYSICLHNAGGAHLDVDLYKIGVLCLCVVYVQSSSIVMCSVCRNVYA